MSASRTETDVDVCSVEELSTAGKRVVDVDGVEVLLVWNDGDPAGLDNICIHKQRRLSEGSLFNGRAVCPGHQWSFDLFTGYCRERDRYAQAHEVRIASGRILVRLGPEVTTAR
jgi:nitrite reductase/ring-hydroxylating ferredoxin subunit